jgi:chemotaxis protein CheY-P-specific phosphatase CheC
MESQSKTLETIIHNGYHRAAESFSAMIGHPVTIENRAVDIQKNPPQPNTSVHKNEPVTLAITRVIGGLRGESYLLLTPDEESVICAMSRNAFGGASIANQLIVKEIDNILSAAVITEFSNVLNLRMYGDVPELYQTVNHDQLIELMNSTQREGDYYVRANANFKFEGHVSISPDFIWKFEQKLLLLLEKASFKAVL